MKCRFLSWLSNAALCLGTALGVSLTAGDCAAQAHDGIFRGHPSSQGSSVCEWLGIPYAEPPVGNLRFAAPVELATNISNTAYLADRYVSRTMEDKCYRSTLYVLAPTLTSYVPLGIRLPSDTSQLLCLSQRNRAVCSHICQLREPAQQHPERGLSHAEYLVKYQRNLGQVDQQSHKRCIASSSGPEACAPLDLRRPVFRGHQQYTVLPGRVLCSSAGCRRGHV